MSIHCSETVDDAIRDRFVCGICNASTQKKLLAEPTLTLDGAVKIAHSIETAGRDASELREMRNFSSTVRKVVGTQKVKPRVHLNLRTTASTTVHGALSKTMLEMWRWA